MLLSRTSSYAILPVLFWSSLLFADQLTLKNGDHITGKIVKKDGGKITVKTDLMGDVTIPWDAVTAVASDQPLTVVLPDGKSVVGTVSTADGRVEVRSTDTPVATSPLPQVSAIRNADEEKTYQRFLRPRLLDLWAGFFDLGLATARGNARTNTFTTSFNATRATRNDKITLHYNQIYATATINQISSATAKAVRGGWGYDRNVSSRLFVNVFNDYEYDQFQNLDLRFVLGGGLGLSALKTDTTRLDVLAGLDYDRDRFSNAPSRNSAEAYWGDEFSHKLNSRASVRQSFRMFNNLSDTGVYRVNFDLGANTNLWKWLSWQFTGSDRFFSNPVPGRQRNDLLLTTGFRISFAR